MHGGCLVLSRRDGEEIVIAPSDNPTVIRVAETRPGRVRLAVTADKETAIHRAETWVKVYGAMPKLPEVA